jgi:hypothetical protein
MPPSKSPSNGKGTHTLTIHFTEPEDIELYDKLADGAKFERRPIPLYALLALHTAFKTVETAAQSK